MRLPTLLFVASLASCGPIGPLDSGAASAFGDVFLYFIHANPGADVMAVRGSHAKIHKLHFGERSYVDGVCEPGDERCVPDLVDRADGIFTVKFDGARSDLDVSDELASMYPQQTGTVVVTGPGRGIVLPHTQNISVGCSLGVVNALAVDDSLTDPGAYNLGIELRATTDHGYVDEGAIPLNTACGELPTDSDEHRSIARSELLQSISAEPWFVPVSCDSDAERTDCLAWGIPGPDNRVLFGRDGQFLAAPPTASYFACVEGAITATSACQDSPSWQDVTVDWAAVEACAAPVTHRTDLIAPRSVRRYVGELYCDVEFRVRTPERDVVFGPNSNDQFGIHRDGTMIGGELQLPQGEDAFWVLYGRPVNPRIWHWLGSRMFVDLQSYPYPD